MAEIRPFRGIRYSEERFADLSPVLSPPYDVVSASDYRALRERSDRNAVRLVLGDKFAGESDLEKYAAVARLFDDWLGDETLVQDRAPAVYLIDQEFSVDGQPRRRRAFIARLRIEPLGTGSVFPHEATMPGPKADRLMLTRAVKMNLSQVFGLYADDGLVGSLLEQMSEVEPAAEGTGLDGVRTTLRVIYHSRLIAELTARMAEKKIVVADGHHRYETAVAYRDEQRALYPLAVDRPWEFVAMAFVASSDPGLVIHPTHRILVGVRGLSAAALWERAAAEFDVEAAVPDARGLVAKLATLRNRHAFALAAPEGARILVHKTAERKADGVVENLDTHILHHRIFAGILNLGPDMWEKGGTIRYIQSAEDCLAAVNRGEAQLAVLMNPTRMDEVESIAFAGGRLPPKSTFFYPKVPVGAVINPLV